MPIKDMTGQRFERLTVIEYAYYDKEKERSFWKCVCKCGNEKIISGIDLRRGHAKSCGCYNVECRQTHGLSGTRLYNVWTHMIHRCYDRNEINYPNYGGRGIIVCDDWKNDYKMFHNWAMENGYKYDLTIDRKEVNGNYEPSNCRWVTMNEQRRNKRDTIYVDHFGKQVKLVDLSQSTGINWHTLFFRYKKGDRNERLVRPVRKLNKSLKQSI